MNIKSFLNTQLNGAKYPNLYARRDHQDVIRRLELSNKLDVHTGCVNTISWNSAGDLILSGSDDQSLSITNPFTGVKKMNVPTSHKSNIFSAKFLPCFNDEKLISCASAGDIQLTDINDSVSANGQNRFCCHGEKTCYELRTFDQDPFIFTSCGQDGCVKWFDIRQSTSCSKQFCQDHTLVKLSTGITGMAINPLIPYHIVCAGLDGVLRFYDRRMLSVGTISGEGFNSSMVNESSSGLFACYSLDSTFNNTVVSNKRITSVQYDNWGRELLVSYQTDKIHLIDWRDLSLENRAGVSNDAPQASSLQAEDPKVLEQNEARKFRIQTDWSDTGPASCPAHEMDSSDPRQVLMKRLNDWFKDLYQNRSNNQGSSASRDNTASAETESGSSSSASSASSLASSSQMSSTLTPAENEGVSKTDENVAMETDSVKEKESSSSRRKSDESLNRTRANERTETAARTETEEPIDPDDEVERLDFERRRREDMLSLRRANLVSLTSSIFGSRIRSKQAMKLENSVLKSKPSPKLVRVFTGHRNFRTMIKECNFWGNDYIMSGSDCGHVFFWDKKTGEIVDIIEADKHVVNCVQENPVFPILATSGIDYDVKIWQPTRKEVHEKSSKINLIVNRNKQMLNENRNTIFIPVQFMIPALRLFGADLNSAPENNNNADS